MTRQSLCGLLFFVPACFSPGGSTDTDADETGAPTSSGEGTGPTASGDPATGSAETGPDASSGETDPDASSGGSGDTEGSVAPEIIEFTVDGGLSPEITESGAAGLFVFASDADGEVVRADFFVDGEIAASVDGPAEMFDAEWIVSGAAANGARELYVVVEDNDGNQTQSDTIEATVEVPNGGLLDVWEEQGGFSYGIAVDGDGTSVVVSGIEQPLLSDPAFGRVQRFVGGAWASDDHAQTTEVVDVVSDGDDGFWGAARLPTGDGGSNTYLIRFDNAGQIVDTIEIDAAVGQGATEDGVDYPRSLSRFPNGDLLVVGVYVPADGSPAAASYAARVTQGGDLAWLEQVTESGEFSGIDIFAYDGAASASDEAMLVGSARVSGINQVWYARLDSNGGVIEEEILAGEYYESIGYGVSVASDDGFVLSGTHRGSNVAEWRRWLRKFAADGTEAWTREGPAETSFTQTVAHDHLDNVLAGSAETCEFNAGTISYWHCAIHLRKYDPDGELVWEEQAEAGASEFNGPLLFAAGIKMDLEVDRFGFAYLSALHRIETPDDRGDWWAARFAP